MFYTLGCSFPPSSKTSVQRSPVTKFGLTSLCFGWHVCGLLPLWHFWHLAFFGCASVITCKQGCVWDSMHNYMEETVKFTLLELTFESSQIKRREAQHHSKTRNVGIEQYVNMHQKYVNWICIWLKIITQKCYTKFRVKYIFFVYDYNSKTMRRKQSFRMCGFGIVNVISLEFINIWKNTFSR